MKRIIALLLPASILLGSCVVVTPVKHDNGKHKGWYKNPKNPHHPAHGATEKGKSKKKAP